MLGLGSVLSGLQFPLSSEKFGQVVSKPHCALYLYGGNLIQHGNMADSRNLSNSAVQSEILVMWFILGRSNLLYLGEAWRGPKQRFIPLCLLVQMKPGGGRLYLKSI